MAAKGKTSGPPKMYDDAFEQLQWEQQRANKDPRIGQLVKAARKGHVEAVQRLLDSGADPNTRDPHSDGLETPVWAAVYARKPQVIKHLADAGADLDKGWPHTPLEVAVNYRHLELIRALIAGGADVNLPNSSHQTPLLTAVMNEDAKAVAELVKCGADPNLIPKKQRYNIITNYSPLQYAMVLGNKAITNTLVSAGGADAKALDVMLLCSAAAKGDLAVVKEKIEKNGVKVDGKGAMDRTPLICAAEAGKAKVVKYLIRRGANMNQTGGRKHKTSPLMSAASSGEVEVVQILVEAGADVDFGVSMGSGMPKYDVLDVAKEARRTKVVQYLLQVRNARGGKKAKAASKARGVTTFDTNDAAILVAGDAEAVAGAFAKRIHAAIWRKDVLGKQVKLARRCYAIFKLSDSPWSMVMKLKCPQFRDLPSAADAAALSKTLKTRSLFVANSDTGGATQYVLFDRGKVAELFDYGSARDCADPKAVIKQFKSAYGIDLSSFDDVQVKDNKTFASSQRKVNVAKIKNDLEFVDAYVREQNAFVPFFVGEWEDGGEKVELSLPGLGPDDIERLDYVAVK